MIGGTYDLGNAQINPGGTYQFTLRSIPVNCTVSWLNIQIGLTPIPSVTTAMIYTAPPGVALAETKDDYDTFLSAVIFGLDLNVSPSFQTMANLSIPRVRTALMYMIGQDIQGPASGTSIVITTGTALSFTIQIPMDMSYLIPDFSLFKQGALRFASAGQLNINYGTLTATNFTGTMANGTTTFTIAPASVSIRLQAKTQQVSNGPGFVGPLWDLKYTGGAQSTGLTKPGIHIGLFDQTGQPQTGVSSYAPTAYNIFNGANSLAQNASPAQQISNYRQERTQGIFADNTGRAIPMQWYQPNDTLADVDQSGSNITYQVTETQSPTLYYLELIAQPPNATDLTDVATRINSGGQVAVDRGVAKSMGGKRPSAAVAPLLPVLLYPASTAPTGLPKMNPSDVGNYVSSAIQSTVATAKAYQSQGKTGHRIARQKSK
jgi:hypothetical protein